MTYNQSPNLNGTIAATTVLKKMGRIYKTPVKIETVLGQITVEWKYHLDGLRVTVFQFPPKFSDSNSSTDEVCSALRIPITAIAKDNGAILSVSTSRPKLIIPVVNSDTVNQLEPDFDMLRTISPNPVSQVKRVC
jgi:predicted PhzF superfamily epimerase YddE/YHI9